MTRSTLAAMTRQAAIARAFLLGQGRYVGDIVRRQIAGATAVVLTKTDLVTAHESLVRLDNLRHSFTLVLDALRGSQTPSF